MFSLQLVKNGLLKSLAVSRHTSKGYKIATFVLLLVAFSINYSVFQTIVVAKKELNLTSVMLIALLDPLIFLTSMHFIVRPFLKLKLLNAGFSKLLLLQLLVCFLIEAVVSTTINLSILQLEYFKGLDFHEFKMSVPDGEVKMQMDKLSYLLIDIIKGIILAFVWSVFYMFWHMQAGRKKMKQELHRAQIQQLTNQLNPHFLFNAFNSIRALIYEDQDKAADTVTQLAELFRTHLQAHLKAKSSLEEEWQVCSRYLAIEKIRLEERLQLEIEIDDALLTQKLPTLSLLTLIENAIKHGISPSSQPGFIKVSASKTSDKCWNLCIVNSVRQQSNAAGTNTGIINIKKRLQLMYGENYSWQQSSENNQFTVNMELPLA